MARKYVFTGVAIAAGLMAATPASAATLLFELSGSRDATFTLESDPVVPDRIRTSSLLGGSQIFFDNVAGTFNGQAGTANINFGSGNIFSALNVNAPGLGFTQFGGADLFSLDNGVPVFNTGTFNLPSIVSGSSTLTISQVAIDNAVPEPGTWLLMLLGFAAIGWTMRQKKIRRVSVSYS